MSLPIRIITLILNTWFLLLHELRKRCGPSRSKEDFEKGHPASARPSPTSAVWDQRRIVSFELVTSGPEARTPEPRLLSVQVFYSKGHLP